MNFTDPDGQNTIALGAGVGSFLGPVGVVAGAILGTIAGILLYDEIVDAINERNEDESGTDEGAGSDADADESTSSGAGPQCIGNNPEESKGRINTDLPGGRNAAEELFDDLTGGESEFDPETGGRLGENDVRIRPGDDGRVRVDVPAKVGSSGKHETIHFND